MLFTYIPVTHSMEKMQEFVDFIFNDVWCKAPIGLEFSLTLFEEKPQLKNILTSFGYTTRAPERGKQFYRDIKDIYEIFATLCPQQISILKQWYLANNDVENVCANNPTNQIGRYTDVTAMHPELSNQLASFFKGLYSQQLLDLAVLREEIGNIDDHYQTFMAINNTGKCPFCGIEDMLGVYHTKRDAYDHYLPKALYPFNSINFRNLAPACHHCNSSYKTSKDPAFRPKDPVGDNVRRKAFYPYAAGEHAIEITIDLASLDIDRLTSDDIQITFGPEAIREEIDTWRDVYGIDERYKAKCLGSDAKDWLEQIRIFHDAHDIDPMTSLATIQQQTEKSPVANSNFLKKAFLDGCNRAGLFEENYKKVTS